MMALMPGDLVKYVPFGIEKRPLALALVMGRSTMEGVMDGVVEIMWMGDPTANFGDIAWVVEENLELVARAGEEE